MSDKENVATAASTSRFGFKGGGGKPAPKAAPKPAAKKPAAKKPVRAAAKPAKVRAHAASTPTHHPSPLHP